MLKTRQAIRLRVRNSSKYLFKLIKLRENIIIILAMKVIIFDNYKLMIIPNQDTGNTNWVSGLVVMTF